MKNRLIAFCMAIVMLFSPLKVSAADEVVISPADLFAPALEDADLPELEEFGADHGTDEQILPAITVAEALIWLLASCGLMAGLRTIYKNSSYFSEWSTGLESNFVRFCTSAGIASATVFDWLSNLASGTLDKTSEVYKKFKAWASGQHKVSQTLTELPSAQYALGLDSFGVSSSSIIENSVGYTYYKLKSNGVNFFLTYTNMYPTIYIWSLTKSDLVVDAKKNLSDDYSEISVSADTGRISSSGRYLTYYYKRLLIFHLPGVSSSAQNVLNYLEQKFSFVPHGTSSAVTLGEYLQKNVFPYVTDTNGLTVGQSVLLSSSPAISQKWQQTGSLDSIDIQIGNDADAQVVDIPWQNVIDQYGSISAQLDQLQEGVISLDQALSSVGAQVVDKTTDEVIAGGVETDKPAEDSKPDEGGGSSSKPEQKPAAYALDLTKYFPFCLPFDLYEFFTLLIAEPEAPKFDFQLDLTGVGLQKYTLSIDLKVFDSVASIVRTTELLLFIGGLITATRAMFIRS